ncbi:hypothetical protein C8R43DRAFT_1050702 [Mycena crocata]|nr:hypothetical protein C8R43DRAFT_1050702 [Mycena crocata]
MAASPSLAALFGSNDAPLPTQTILVREIVQNKEAELSALENAISELQASLQSLQDKRAELASEIRQCNGILSPVRQLPTEIIGEIFLYFVPILHPTIQRSRVDPPWKLGHICRLWRGIALSLVQLWAVLDIGTIGRSAECKTPRVLEVDSEEDELTMLPSPQQPSQHAIAEAEDGHAIESALELIKECIQRSGKYPLSFRIHARDFALLPLINGLLKHSSRWREMTLIEAPQFLLDHISHSQRDLQQLTKIALCGGQRLQYQCVPNLTDLTLTHVYLPQESHTRIPWAQLTRYCEHQCTWAPTEQLASYRKLTRLAVLDLTLNHHSFLEDSILSFPSLRIASFRFDFPYYYHVRPDVMRCFEMPVLEAFTIEYPISPRFDACIPRGSPRLKILRLCIGNLLNQSGDDSNVERALEMFPNLTEISLDVQKLISNKVISKLIPSSHQLPLAPKLEVIRFSNGSFIDNDCKWTTLVEMLHARFEPAMSGISPLRTFEFHRAHQGDPDLRNPHYTPKFYFREFW